jgi:hypothetical protein
LAVEIRHRLEADVELASIRDARRIDLVRQAGGRDGTLDVLVPNFRSNRVTGPPVPTALRSFFRLNGSPICTRVCRKPMDRGSFVEALARKFLKVRNGLWSIASKNSIANWR